MVAGNVYYNFFYCITSRWVIKNIIFEAGFLWKIMPWLLFTDEYQILHPPGQSFFVETDLKSSFNFQHRKFSLFRCFLLDFSIIINFLVLLNLLCLVGMCFIIFFSDSLTRQWLFCHFWKKVSSSSSIFLPGSTFWSLLKICFLL